VLRRGGELGWVLGCSLGSGGGGVGMGKKKEK